MLYGDYKNITHAGFASASTILIAVGCVIAVLGFSGCYGAMRGLFDSEAVRILPSVLMAAEVALGLWVYFAHFNVVKLLKQFLNQILSKYQNDKGIQNLIDRVQRRYGCCGSNNCTDWFNSDWTPNVKTEAYLTG